MKECTLFVVRRGGENLWQRCVESKTRPFMMHTYKTQLSPGRRSCFTSCGKTKRFSVKTTQMAKSRFYIIYNNVLPTEMSPESSCSMKLDDTLLIKLLIVCVRACVWPQYSDANFLPAVGSICV